MLRQGPGSPLSWPLRPRAAGRPQPPLSRFDHRKAFFSRYPFARRLLQARAVPVFPSPTHGPEPPPPAAFPFTFCNGSSRAIELKAGRKANGRHHFGLRNARKRRALIGCVGTRGGATRVRRRASAARVRACSVLLGFVRIGNDLRVLVWPQRRRARACEVERILWLFFFIEFTTRITHYSGSDYCGF